MAYTKTNWKDLICSLPSRFKLKNTENGTVEHTYDFERDYGEVEQYGTSLSADKMNNLETGVYNNDSEISKIKNGTTAVKNSSQLGGINADKYARNDVSNTFSKSQSIASNDDVKLTLKSTDTDNKNLISFNNSSGQCLGKFGYDGGFKLGTGSTLNEIVTTDKLPINHASTASTFGVGTSSKYGHVKIADNVTSTTSSGIALGAKQGKVLNDKIEANQYIYRNSNSISFDANSILLETYNFNKYNQWIKSTDNIITLPPPNTFINNTSITAPFYCIEASFSDSMLTDSNFPLKVKVVGKMKTSLKIDDTVYTTSEVPFNVELIQESKDDGNYSYTTYENIPTNGAYDNILPSATKISTLTTTIYVYLTTLSFSYSGTISPSILESKYPEVSFWSHPYGVIDTYIDCNQYTIAGLL